MSTKTLAYLALFTTAIIWGITLPLMKVTLNTVPPISLAFLRFSLAATLALSFAGFSNLKWRDFFHIGIYSFFGISLNIGLLLIGLKFTSTIDATMILTLAPILTSFFAAIVIKEKISNLHILGIFLAFLGVFSYILLPALATNKISQINVLGDLLILGAVLSAMIFTIGSKTLFATYRPASISSISFFVGAVSFLPGTFLEYVQNPLWIDSFTGASFFSVVFLGIFSSFIAYNLLEWGLSKVDVHVNVTIGYLSSIIAIILATLFLGEKLHLNFFLVSATLVGVGIFLVTKHKAKSLHFHHKLSHHT